MITRYGKLLKGIKQNDLGYRIDWIRLVRTPRVGPHTFFDLLAVYGSPSAALGKLQNLPKHNVGKIPSYKEIEAEIDKVSNLGGRIILPYDHDYPKILLEIPSPPLALTLRGKLSEPLWPPAISIVGARNASANGCYLAKNLAAELGRLGYFIVSGLARGIDAAAHQGALQSGTIGVIATGIDQVYPRENTKLYEQIYMQGLVLSEYSLGQVPLTQHFPQRNRIISGLSLGVIVIEAAERSGTLTTARYALDQGREVFAVPGSPLDPRCRGTNNLLKQGATLVETVDDIIDALGQGSQVAWNNNFTREDPQLFEDEYYYEGEIGDVSSNLNTASYKTNLISFFSYSPIDLVILQELVGIPTKMFRTLIVELELEGIIERLPNDRAVLVGRSLEN